MILKLLANEGMLYEAKYTNDAAGQSFATVRSLLKGAGLNPGMTAVNSDTSAFNSDLSALNPDAA
jgi:hypothetical protein